MHTLYKFGHSNLNQLHVFRGQANFSSILSQNDQNDLKGQRSMTPTFNTSRMYSKMHVWCKFGESRPNRRGVVPRTSQIP